MTSIQERPRFAFETNPTLMGREFKIPNLMPSIERVSKASFNLHAFRFMANSFAVLRGGLYLINERNGLCLSHHKTTRLNRTENVSSPYSIPVYCLLEVLKEFVERRIRFDPFSDKRLRFIPEWRSADNKGADTCEILATLSGEGF